MSYNFIHLSIQELLAAYCISKMEENQHVQVFQALHGDPRFSAVIQFYAGFTKLTNQGVQNMITRTSFTASYYSKVSRLNYMRCLFEAQLCDQSFYQQFVQKLNRKINVRYVTMSPLDCMAFGYFLAFVLRHTSELCVDLMYCRIDDHSLCVLMGEISKHAEGSRESVLHGVTELNISHNKIGDNGIAYIATALQTNTTMNVRRCDISEVGAESLARALAINRSLQEMDISRNKIINSGIAHIATALQTNNTLKTLRVGDETVTDEGAVLLSSALSSMEYLELEWTCTHPDSTLKKIRECVRKSKLRILELHMHRSRPVGEAPTTEQVKEWLQCVEVGGQELIQSLESRNQLRLCCYTHLGTFTKHYNK